MPTTRLAEEHAKQLQLLTHRLASTLSREEIGNLVIGQTHEYLGASASVAYFAAPDGQMRLAASRGVAHHVLDKLTVLDLDADLPLSRVIRTGKPVWYENRDAILVDFPNTAAATGAAPIAALAALALVFGEHTLGGIAFSFPDVMQFDPPTRDLVTTFALQCALALEHTRLFEEQHRARIRLEILAETADRLSKARLDLGVVLDTVCREVATRMPESCTINLIGADGETLELAAVHHTDPEAEAGIRATLAGTPVRVGESALGRVAASGRPLLIAHVPHDAMLIATRPEYRPYLERYPIGSLLIVPLRVAERVIGTLTTTRLRGRPPYTLDDQRLLQDLADRSALAIENARLFEAEQQARRLCDDFLMIAGHELRTPLAALQLQMQTIHELAGRGTFGAQPELLVDRLDKTLRHIARLDGLVAQLLDVSQLTRGRVGLHREPVDAGVLVREIVDRFADLAARSRSPIALSDDEAVIGRWDRGRLDQVLTNVIGNAIKYGAGKPIHIRLAKDHDACRITVRDEGVGIERDAQDRIFGRFERATSDCSYGGLGLGLWMSRQIVEALGGTITCESETGKGTTVDIMLPLDGGDA